MDMQNSINPGYDDDEVLSFLPLCHMPSVWSGFIIPSMGAIK